MKNRPIFFVLVTLFFLDLFSMKRKKKEYLKSLAIEYGFKMFSPNTYTSAQAINRWHWVNDLLIQAPSI